MRDRKLVVRRTRSRGDVGGHSASGCKLLLRHARQQRDYQVLKRDHTDSELDEFGVRQLRDVGADPSPGWVLLRAVRLGSALILPPRKRETARIGRLR